MEDVRLIVALVLALGFAVLGGLAAHRLGLPSLIGYMLAGFLVGPDTPGFDADRDQVFLLANLGVAFLMFALGVEFSFNELLEVRRIALITAGIQIPLTILLGAAVGLAIGWDTRAAILLGGVFAISSSIVIIKLLLSRGEASSAHARVALGLGVVQDLSLVPMIALLPLLSGETHDLGPELARSLGVAAVALAAVIFVGTRIVPWVLYRVALIESRELFLLTVVVIALGTAYASHEAGLSLALGAFLAGLVVSESEFDAQVLTEIIPLRDVFSTLFFVSLGMLIRPSLVTEQPLALLIVVSALVVGKLLIAGGAYLAAGVDHRTATYAALIVAQIGEFSFVLAGVGLEDGIIDGDQYGLILGAALGSILLAPFLLRLAPLLVQVAAQLPGVAAQEAAQVLPSGPHEGLRRHVVVCGYGRVGQVLGEALTRRGLKFVVIEINPVIVRDLQRRGVTAYYGDAAAETLLRRAGIEEARTIAVTTPDLTVAMGTVRTARRLNPRIDIVTRANVGDEVELLRGQGATEVVQPEFEAGLEFVRHVLRRQGVSSRETQALVGHRRATFYQIDQPHSLYDEEPD
ncbi:MAG: cation:proton antiporter [Chloroflexia bacterium]|nr:cation:proton antiporter [Chloroflexia bacterium]